MIKKHIKLTFENLGLQIFFSVLSMFFMPFFSWMDNWTWIFSIMTGWLFLGSIHSTYWQLGRKDAKNTAIKNNHLESGQQEVKLSLFGGLKFGSIFFIVNVLLVIITAVFKDVDVLFSIHRFMVGPLFGFLPPVDSDWYWIVSVLLCIVMYIPCITAYISGV